jgi:hypothetical protein
VAGQIKMVFIISDEDLIRQLSSNKPKNTHIIDLNNNEQVNSIVKYNLIELLRWIIEAHLYLMLKKAVSAIPAGLKM